MPPVLPRSLCLLRFLLIAGFVGSGLALQLAADVSAPAKLGPGATFDVLRVGATTTYRQVEVRSINARTLLISHAGGLTSIRLEDLPRELQVAFGYDSGAAAAADEALKAAQARNEENRRKSLMAQRSSKRSSSHSSFERLLQSFGEPPEIRPSVDLRPQFQALDLNVKNQGPRPSCAVFAVISALEYQNAQLTGKAERFSEEYLIWATCKVLNRVPTTRTDEAIDAEADAENFDNIDAGFSLSEVVTALRSYGVASQHSLPYLFVTRMATADPAPEIIAEARERRRVSIVPLPGRDQTTRLANLIQSLDAGVPVAIGIRWPPSRGLRTGFLSKQRPLDRGGHAVNVVGYENKTGAIEDTVFIFKNSWGIKWGTGGYGFVTYEYLMNNLVEAALLDIQPAARPESAAHP